MSLFRKIPIILTGEIGLLHIRLRKIQRGDIMLKNPEDDWGEVFYPRAEEKSIDSFVLVSQH